MSVNNVTLVGNIAGEIKMNPNNTVASFQVSTRDYDSKVKEKVTMYHNVALYGKAAARLSEFLAKGSPIALTGGKLVNSKWEGKDGVTKYKTSVEYPAFSFVPKDYAEQSGSPVTTEEIPF